MIRSDNQIEADAKKILAVKDFQLLSTHGVVGAYKECELTHIFLFEIHSKTFYHYYAVLSYEEYTEPINRHKDKFLTPNLININNKYKLGIKQSRISFDSSKNIFDGLCINNLLVDEKQFFISKSFTLLPKAHIPSYWENEFPLLQKVLKTSIWGDSYIIEFFSNLNPFEELLTNKDFIKINENIKNYINIDLDSINDRIGSFVFQFPITLVEANIRPKKDWCNAEYSIKTYSPFDQNENLISIISTDLDNVITGCNNLEGICNNFFIELGDSHNLELLIINKQNKLIYKHFKGNYSRYFNIGGNIGIYNSEPRTFINSDNENISIDLFSNNFDAGKSYDGNYAERIRKRMRHNDTIKKSGKLAAFNKQRKEALAFIRKLIQQNNSNISEIWILDPYLLSKDIIDTLYYQPTKGIKLKCITSYKKSRKLLVSEPIMKNMIFQVIHNIYNFFKNIKPRSRIYYFNKYKSEQNNYFLTHSNNLGIFLEFRTTYDNIGFDFHDRFLFFIPKGSDNTPIVYSLGTSINALGKAHHIIQEVPDSKSLMHTFQYLWNLLDNKNSLIIKLPEN